MACALKSLEIAVRGKVRIPGPCVHICLSDVISVFFFLVIMDRYQEQPHLLDPHLGKNRG